MAYFTRGEAARGNAGITLNFGGQTIRFSTAGHREMFQADPQKYAPQYDGQCAYAMSKDHRTPADPKSFAIVDGKLYLFSQRGLVERFRSEADRLIAEADRHWAALAGSLQNKKGKL